MISSMVYKLDFIERYGDYLFPKDLKLRKALVRVYAVILKFCVDASRLFLRDDGKKRNALDTFRPRSNVRSGRGIRRDAPT